MRGPPDPSERKVPMFKNALISVSDKTHLADFIKPLAHQGTRLVSTGGTAKYLRDHSFKVIDVSEQTQFPEVMGGRVKTLHPYIHMGLLSRDHVSEDQELLKEHDLTPFDLVVGNLYPFEKAFQKGCQGRELTESIDIGGPSLLRAAAKNFERICVVCDPADYPWIHEKGELTLEDRRYLASKVFSHTSSYDSLVAKVLLHKQELKEPRELKESWDLPKEFSKELSFAGQLVSELRYGENPQQKAAWYRCVGSSEGLQNAQIIQGKPLSYNNLLDLDAATSLLMEFSKETCCVSIKHNNPCGVGLGHQTLEAIERSLIADPVSVFGGIVAINEKIGAEEAKRLTALFLECVIAPEYTPEALEIFRKKKNLRLLQWRARETTEGLSFKTINGGFLVQSGDALEDINNWEGAKPSPEVMEALVLAWKVAMKLKSNSIAIARQNQTLGLGMGQVNRVDAVVQAIGRMNEFHKDVKGAVLASDAFFPFPDSIEVAASAGVKWVIQPGGSLRDSKVLETAQRLGVNMVLTKTRHFLH